MSNTNKPLSGFQKRKKNLEKLLKEKELLRKVPKMDSFFASSRSNNLNVLVSNDCSEDNQPERVSEKEKSPQNLISENIITQDERSISDDPAKWVLDDATIEYLVLNGVKQNMDIDFSFSKRQYADTTRFLSLSLFSRKLPNGEIQPRPWLIFSKTKGTVFCAPCKLFKKSGSLSNDEGYNDWKNAGQRMKEHENSDDHRSACAKLLARKNAGGRIDERLVLQMEEEIKYWHEVLRRVVAVVRSLSARGLPFRGSEEKFGLRNSGNYIMSLELLAEFDPFLNIHIKRYGNKGSGTTSYLSSKVCDEIIDIMAKKVISTIVTEIRQAKYFSISIDSTPDISHVDQLSFIVRYVSKEGCPIERFIRFIPNCSHKAKDMATIVLQTLKNYDLDIANCRGQSYDNASNMSGAYSGLQARIKEVNSLAVFVPCSAHSLNLVGSCAAESCEAAISFFSNLQALYNFFSISTHRWGLLVSKLKPNSTVLKSLSQTRWSAQGDACKSLCISWIEIMEALKIIANDMSEKPSTRFEASGLLNCFGSLEMCFLTLMWNDVLERFNKVSKSLQSVDIGLGTVVELYHSLVTYLEGIREDGIFDIYESRAIELSGEQNYTYDLKRKPKRKVQFDEVKRNDTELSGRNRFRVTTYKVIIDRLITELQRRGTAYEKLSNKFDFLTKLNILNTQEVCEGAFNLKDFYPGDLDENIKNECLHLQAHLLSTEATKEKKMSSLELYKFILENGFIDIYPNIGISLRMLLSTPVSNCSAERSFSALKRIKNYLRSNTGKKKHTSLAVLYIESEVMQAVDYSEVIRSFAEQKARRVKIC